MAPEGSSSPPAPHRLSLLVEGNLFHRRAAKRSIKRSLAHQPLDLVDILRSEMPSGSAHIPLRWYLPCSATIDSRPLAWCPAPPGAAGPSFRQSSAKLCYWGRPDLS